LTNFRVVPQAVVLPKCTEEVQAIVRLCQRERIPFVPRGAGTGLSGGALPVAGGIVISLARMKRILEVDIPNARVVVEPGVINSDVTARVASANYFYAPDPSSQSVCSIGGNVAENSGGAHCLKYGFTTTHVLGLEVALPNGTLVHLGGKTPDMPGYDLAGVFVGSEGTLGIATKITLRIVKRPECVQTLLAAFATNNEASSAVSDIIASGILPAAIEMMDRLAIRASTPFASGTARRKFGLRGPLRNVRCFGKAEKQHSRQWDGSRPTTSCKMAWCRGLRYPRS
jgi:glycolate oxidase